MRVVATYSPVTGRISSMCVIPPDSGISSVGLDVATGHSIAVLDVLDDEIAGADDAGIHAKMRRLMADYVIQTSTTRLVKSGE